MECTLFLAGEPADKLRLFLIFYLLSQDISEVNDIVALFLQFLSIYNTERFNTIYNSS